MRTVIMAERVVHNPIRVEDEIYSSEAALDLDNAGGAGARGN
jgi:hypothetical protein